MVGFVIGACLGGLVQAIPIATRKQPELLPDGIILYEGLAVNGDPLNDAGGWLFLTNQHLRFKTHGMSSRRREFKLPLNELVGFETETKKRGSNRKLLVQMFDGKIEKFYVESAKIWQKRISEQISKVSESTKIKKLTETR